MRPVRGFGAIGVLLSLTLHVHADGISYRATVKVPEAEVRSGHGTDAKLYATNKLHYGETVEVTKDLQDGWLEIMPPRRSSFSWINARMLENSSTNVWIVKGEPGQPVDVYFGSSLREAKPDVRSTSVVPGSMVVSIAKARAADDGLWLPIEPPPSERRYILRDALAQPNAPPPAKMQSNDPSSESARPASLPARPAAPAPSTGAVSTLVADAQKAEGDGDYGTALKLWQEVARQTEQTNSGMALNCRNHVQWLRTRIDSIAAGNAPMPRTNDRLYPTPASAYGAANCYQAPVTPCYNGTTRSYSQGTAAVASRESQPPVKTKRTGRLELAQWSPDGKPAYKLISGDGRTSTFIYVLPQKDVNLEPFVDRNVELEGTLEYHSEPRKTFLVTTAVNPMP